MTIDLANQLIPKVEFYWEAAPEEVQTLAVLKRDVLGKLDDWPAIRAMSDFAAHFKGKNDFAQFWQLREFHRWSRAHIRYAVDAPENQVIKDPAFVWYDRWNGTDCKSLTIWAVATGVNLGLPMTVNFMTLEPIRNQYTGQLIQQGHVFPAVIIKNKEYPLDLTMERFGEMPSNYMEIERHYI